MVLLIITLLLFTAAIATKKYSDDSPLFGVFGILFSIITFLSAGFGYVIQVGDIAELNVIDKRINIVENKANDVTNKLQSTVNIYLEHEENIFTEISSASVHLYAVKYPELKSDKTYTFYAEKLTELHTAKYELKLEKVSLERNIERRKRQHFHLITFLIPRE